MPSGAFAIARATIVQAGPAVETPSSANLTAPVSAARTADTGAKAIA